MFHSIESIPTPVISALTLTVFGSEQGGMTGRLKLALNVGACIKSTLKYAVSEILQLAGLIATYITVY